MASKVSKVVSGKQDAVVFMSKGNVAATAFVLKTGKLYKVDCLSAATMYQYLNTTYPFPIYVESAQDDGRLTLSFNGLLRSVPTPTEPAHPFSSPDNNWYTRIFVADYVYTLEGFHVLRQLDSVLKLPDHLGRLPLFHHVESRSTALFNDNIVLLDKIDRSTSTVEAKQWKIKVYSFSLSDFRTQELDTWENTSSAVTFYFAGIHILTGRGDLWRVDDTDGANLKLQRCHYEEHKDFPSTNWSTDIPLCGAVVHGSELVVFSNALPSDVDLPEKTVANYGWKVKFMQILAYEKCHHVQLPESWLTKEIST